MSFRFTLCFVLSAASVSWAQSDAPARSPADWKRMDVGPVSFLAPSDVRTAGPLFAPKEDPASTPETVTAGPYVRDFAGPTLYLHVDYAPASEDMAVGDKRDYRSHDESINGKPARIESFTAPTNGVLRWENYRVVRFAETNKPGMHLTMVASCDGATSCHEAEDIFRTVRFK